MLTPLQDVITHVICHCFPNLASLNLDHATLSPLAFSQLSGLSRLQELILSSATLNNVQQEDHCIMSFGSTPIKDEALFEALAPLRRLQHLNLGGLSNCTSR